MTTKPHRNYEQARRLGYTAAESLRISKTLEQWNELERQGIVRLQATPEQESYFDVYGEPEGYVDGYGKHHTAKQERQAIIDLIDRQGLWYVSAEVRDVQTADSDDEWETVDSIGMSIANNPTDWRDNCYVPDLMAAAIKECEKRFDGV